MATRSEIVNAILKGLGRRPTSNLLRWSPTWKNPLRFDLIEVSRCRADGGVVPQEMAQHLRPLHAGHHIVSPSHFSFWEFFQVQVRLIR
jgi:hypothetical protein